MFRIRGSDWTCLHVAGQLTCQLIASIGSLAYAPTLSLRVSTPTPGTFKPNARVLTLGDSNSSNNGPVLDETLVSPKPSTTDSDGDGINDQEESEKGLNPNQVDVRLGGSAEKGLFGGCQSSSGSGLWRFLLIFGLYIPVRRKMFA
ncbi:MAG: thrombospondin type 3 repeat-containing protein [Bdellovibrionota bacterium]